MKWFAGCIMACGLFALSAYASEQSIPNQYSPNLTNFYLAKPREKADYVKDVLPKLPKHQREFVENYVKVKRFQDDVLLKDLIHPASRACENDENLDYFDYIRWFYLTEELPEIFRLQILEIAPDKTEALKKRLGYPIAPTHVMFIEYGEDNRIEGLQRYLREERKPVKRIYELVKCPDAETLKTFRQQMEHTQ